MMGAVTDEQPIRVPYQQVPAETLHAIAEDFCTRDGTDYGEHEMPLADRVALLMQQLRHGEACLLFEASTQTLRIVTAQDAASHGL